MHGLLGLVDASDASMGEFLLTRWTLKIGALIFAGVNFLSCTSKDDARIPDETVMHFPYSMALSGKYLATASTAADGKYDVGRLVIMDTSSIKSAASGGARTPISWQQVVVSNILVPQDIGEILFVDDYLAFASRQNSKLVAMPVKNGILPCSGADAYATSCDQASTVDLPELDPFTVVNAFSDSRELKFLVSYLSADRIDVMRIDKTKTSNFLEKGRELNGLALLSLKINADNLRDQRIITKKIQVTFKNDLTQSKTYFLFERHPARSQGITRPKAIYLVSIDTRNVMADSAIDQSMIEVWDLSEIGSISGAVDFFVDEKSSFLYVLSNVPETLYKLDLTQRNIVETSVVCTAATMMAVDSADDTIAIPCYKDNRLITYSLSTLQLKTASHVIGRGPAYTVIDPVNEFFYTTLIDDGILAIFNKKLEKLGHIFKKAPINRTGS